MTGYNASIPYNAPIPYNGGVAADRTPSDHLRFKVAFSTDPDDPSPAWVDLSSRVHLPSGITISRGRGDEFDSAQTGRMVLSLENIDGALSPENASGAYYPNVIPGRRCALDYRDPATLGLFNMLPAEDASLEGGTVGGWVGDASAVVANSATHADNGTKALRVTWPTGGSPSARLAVTGLVVGRTYAARARVWSAAGVPDIKLGVVGILDGAATSVKGAFADVMVSFTATANTHTLKVLPASASTSGQQTWVDAIMLDEGTSLGTFTTISPTAGAAIVPRFDGHIDEWPIEWPDGGETYSRSTITATDLLARLDSRRKLRSVVVETMALDEPSYHFPLGEPNGSTTVADIASSVPATLSVATIGAGGTLEFAQGTGAPTDGLAAPLFTPGGTTDGTYLDGPLPVPIPGAGPVVLEATFNTTAANACIAVLYDNWGNFLQLSVSGGVLHAERGNTANFLTSIAAGYPGAVDDGETHHATLTMTESGGTVTLALSRDGLTAGTDGTGSTTDFPMVPWSRLAIGALKPLRNLPWTGTISHVALYDATLAVGRALEHRLALSTGFSGEATDDRLARVCAWIGFPAARCDFDAGLSSIGHLDCTGLGPLVYMRKVAEDTEGGLLFASTDGLLTFQNRARSYAVGDPTLSLPVHMVEPSARLAKNLLRVKNIVSGSRVNGATVVMSDQASIDANGPLDESIDVIATTDDDVALAVGWRFTMSRTPRMRFTSLDLDAYTDPTYSPQILAALDIGVRVEITGMPLQATSTLRQVIQGYSESINHEGWEISANATPYEHTIALVLDDPTFGELDAYPLAY